MGDSECSQHVLEGAYIFPEGIDPATKMLLEECSIMHLSMSREELCTLVAAENYQYYWKQINECTSSSYSRLNFGHYITAADSKTRSKLHAANIFEVTGRRFLLERGGVRVKIFLEKSAGATVFNTLRATCLFETDFN